MRNIITGKDDDRAKLMLKTMGKPGIEKLLRHAEIVAIVAEAGHGWEDAVQENNEGDEKATEGGNTCVGGIEPNGADDGGIEPKKGIEPDGGIDPKSIAAIEKKEQCVNLELERFLHAVHHPGSDEELIAILKKSTAVVRAPPEGKSKLCIIEKTLTVEHHEKLARSKPFFNTKSGAVPPPSEDMLETWGRVMQHFSPNAEQNVGDHLLWWAGDSCATADKKAKKLAEKMELQECASWTTIPNEQDSLARWNYRACGEAPHASEITKKRRFGSLQEHTMDRVDIFSAGRLELEEVS